MFRRLSKLVRVQMPISNISGRKYAILKLKILLSTVLRNYKVTSDVTEDQFKLQADIILKRTDGFRLKIEPRQRVPTTVA